MGIVEKKEIERVGSEFFEQLLDNKPVFLIGSVISNYSPTNLPMGATFGQKLYDYIFPDFQDLEYDWFRKEFGDMPFEGINDSFPIADKLPIILTSIFKNATPNELHLSIAHALRENLISAVITPNYDLAIDTCLRESRNNVSILFDDDSCKRFNQTFSSNHSTSIYFKIHGSIESPDSLIYSLDQEKNLSPFKRETLSNILNNRVLIVLGYSGKDFDICPIIANKSEFKYSKIVWLCYSEDGNTDNLTPYAKLLVESHDNNVILYGTLIKFINRIFNKKIRAKCGLGTFNPLNTYDIPPTKLLEWQIIILNRLGAPSLAEKALYKYKHLLPKPFFLFHQRIIYNHKGHFLSGLRISQDILNHYSSGDIGYQENLENMSAQYLATHHIIKSYILLKKAKDHAHTHFRENKVVHAMLLHREILFWSYLARHTPIFLKGLFRYFACQLGKKVQSLFYIDISSWPQKQGLLLAIRRLKCKGFKLSGNQVLLDPQIGFRNLGLPAHDIISFKQDIEQLDAKSLTCEMRKKLSDDFNIIVGRAKKLGKNDEIWKLYRARYCKIDDSPSEKLESLKGWKGYLGQTEYPNPIKFYLNFCILKAKIACWLTF